MFAELSLEDLVALAKELHKRRSFKGYLFLCGIAHVLRGGKNYSLRKLAADLGLSYNRCTELARIWERIVEPAARRGLELLPLPRDFLHHSLRASDPLEAYLYAQELRARAGLTIEQFRQATVWGLPARFRRCQDCEHFGRLTGETLVACGPYMWRKVMTLAVCHKKRALFALELGVNTLKEGTFCSYFARRSSTSTEPRDTTYSS